MDKPGERDDWFYTQRTAGTNRSFTLDDASVARSQAAREVLAMRQASHVFSAGPAGFDGAWSNVGPDPIASSSRAYSGRVSALAVRSSPPYTIYLGAAQGGLWVSSTLTAGWVSRSDTLPTQAMGAIALAPSNEDIVYVGTGEGAFSGDSYFGDGLYRSDDGGRSFRHVSGDAIVETSISRVLVDPVDPDHVFIATLRGVSGNRSVAPSGSTPYGVWESRDGGISWTPLYTTQTNRGATDLVMDPLNPQVLLASFWMQGIVKTVDGGQNWYPAMTGLPANADWADTTARSRIALGLSHPSPDAPAVVYAGFNWADTSGRPNAATVWKSTDAGETGTRPVAAWFAATVADSAGTTTRSWWTAPTRTWSCPGRVELRDRQWRRLPQHGRRPELGGYRLRPAPGFSRRRPAPRQAGVHRHRQRRRGVVVVDARRTDWPANPTRPRSGPT